MILLILCLILFLLMTVIGGVRGIKSFLVLIYNAIILFVSIFLIAHGFNPFLIMFLSSVLFSLLTVFYQNGTSTKTVASLLSIIFVLLVVSVVIYYIGLNAHISGLNEIELEEGNNYMNYALSVNMLHVLLASIMWGTLGAVTDTAISVCSALNEIHLNNTHLSISQLIKSGMNIGKDILGTTINTLTFVGFGESLMLFIYYVENDYTLSEIINSKSFFSELSSILISCIACVMIIPASAILFSVMVKKQKTKEKAYSE